MARSFYVRAVDAGIRAAKNTDCLEHDDRVSRRKNLVLVFLWLVPKSRREVDLTGSRKKQAPGGMRQGPLLERLRGAGSYWLVGI